MTYVGYTRDGITRNPQPWVTVLNYSGGQQSTALLWRVLRGELKPNPNCNGRFLVLSADPGMEGAPTYRHVEAMQQRCRDAGLHAVTVPGPDLAQDLVSLESSERTRLDNPPFFTRSESGKKGRLVQKCTKFYKIDPMDRYLRSWMAQEFGIPASGRPKPNTVEKWIGFAADERHRIDAPRQAYQYFRFPLVELGATKVDAARYILSIGEELPPPSVCRACPANSIATFRKMRDEDPEGFELACQIDEQIRDLTSVGVREEAFVSSSLRPVREIVDDDDEPDDEPGACDSGYCFT